VPELVFAQVDSALGRNEGDPEIRSLLDASVGLNLAMDFLPGSVMFDPTAEREVDPNLASDTVWFDAFITNIDRTPRNPNLLVWHRALYLIDHGAAMYFHHDWRDLESKAASRFPAIRDHVLLPWASRLADADQRLRARLSHNLLSAILDLVPDAWLTPEPGAETPDGKRAAYLDYFARRLNTNGFFEEALSAYASRL